MSSDACSDVCSPAVTVLLPTVDDGNERTTKKGRRKGSKGKNDDNWRYCVPNCLHSGKSPNELIQCHLCQSWIHPECVGEDGKDIVGIWTCTTCRQLPVLVARLVEKTSSLETLIEKLTFSNQQLVALVVEQQQDLRKLCENISIPTTTTTDTADSPHISDAKSVTLLVGNSLLRDVSAVGIDTIAVRRKSGATLEDIGDMIEEVRHDDNLDVTKIVIVGGTREVMGIVPAHEIKEKIELLVQKAKTVTPSVTVSSVLPCSKGANPEQLAEFNSAIKHVCDDMNVIFVDHESNLTFRNGDVDTSAFHADGIHLSASGVDRVCSNLSLPKQTSRKTVKRQRHASTRRSAIRVDERARRSTARTINRDTRPANESHQHQQTQRYLRRSTDRDVTQQHTRDDMQRDDNEWRVVSRRRSTHDRRTSEQCAKCNESNHVTARCKHAGQVQCRRCGKLGHKEKHHAYD